MYRFYGQFEPQVDRFIFERYFPDPNIKGVFVECGAFDGVLESSCKFFEETMGWSGFNFEPIPWVYEELCMNRPNSRNLNYALSSTSGQATFSAVNHPQFGVNCTNGSLAHTEKHRRFLEQTGCEFVPVDVSLLTWTDFIGQQGILHVDLLVLDVEGHELSVIQGMHGCEVLPDVICIEVGHLNFGQIRTRLGELGYSYDVSSHANAFFIRDSKLPLCLFRSGLKSRPLSVSESPSFTGSSLAVNGVIPPVPIESLEKLEEDNAYLRKRCLELTVLYQEIVSSKSWRAIEMVRRLFGRYSKS